MSESMQKVKVKRDQDGGPPQKPAIPSPKGSNVVKVKKEGDSVIKKDWPVKKEAESPMKKDSVSLVTKLVKVKKDGGDVKNSKLLKQVTPPTAHKEKVSALVGKVKTVKKEEFKMSASKASSSSSKDASKKKMSKEEAEKKEKKVYELPGQKHDPPDERDPLRIFYESLYKENPKSEMAEVWMMEHGLLERDMAKKAFERKKKSQLSQKMGSPVKVSKEASVKVAKTITKKVVVSSNMKRSSVLNGESKSASKMKRKLDSEDEDDDFIVKPKKKANTST